MLFTTKHLCETVCRHLSGLNVLKPDYPVMNRFPNKMVMDIDMFGTGVTDRVILQVLEHSGSWGEIRGRLIRRALP